MKEENSDDRELKSDSKEMCFVLRMLLVALESALKILLLLVIMVS